MLRPVYVRNYESVLRELAERGHSVHVAFSDLRTTGDELEQVEELAAAVPGLTFSAAASRDPSDGWWAIAAAVRYLGDFARYLDPRFRDAPALRARAERKLVEATQSPTIPHWVRSAALPVVRWLGRRSSPGLARSLAGLCRAAEASIPPSANVVGDVRARAAAAVLVTPLVDFGSDQPEYVKAARSLGVPSALCVASWDNLTNKGVMRVDPELVFVWNEEQRREAVALHGVPAERVVVTGAQRFDEWFERRPSRPAADFRSRAGLDPQRPHLLYVCSSAFVAPSEVGFVERWARAVRESDVRALEEIGLLVRPHPQNAEQWAGADLEALANVAVWPRAGAHVVDEEAKAGFYDSIAHASAVVGINTSAQIEACILGKPVLTILAPEFDGTQLGTLHYRYLRRENGGFLVEAATLDEHVGQLARCLDAAGRGEAHTGAFVASFVRPLGIDRPGTPVLADGIERLAAMQVRRGRRTLGSRALGPVLSFVAAWQRRAAESRRAGGASIGDSGQLGS